jgi:anti-anti-sigma factor
MSNDDGRAVRGAPEAASLTYSVHTDTTAGTVVLRGELDAESAHVVDQLVERQIAQRHLDLTVDLGQVTFFDLAGVDVLLAAQVRVREHGGRLVVVGHDDLFARVARICGAESLLGGSVGAPGRR